MTISSRTPEGEPNTCPVCLKELRIEPSTMPIRDAPCPHCGHLLRFDTQSELDELFSGSPYPSAFSTSFEKTLLEVGTPTLGTFPFALRDDLLETIALLALKHRLPEQSELAQIVEEALVWPRVIVRLRDIAESDLFIEQAKPAKSLRKQIQQFFSNLLDSK
jgi:hypothetical protein